MTDHPPPSKHPGAPALASEDELSGDAKPEFDPYKFSKVTVPPDLRRQMVQAHLPRLEAEFFHDTLPPHLPGQTARQLEHSPDSPRLALREDLPPRRRPIKLVIACVFGALLLLALGLLKARTELGPTSSATLAPPRASSHVTLEAAVPARTTASASYAGAGRALTPKPVESAIAPSPAGRAAAFDKRSPRIGASVVARPKPTLSDQPQKPETDATPAPTSIASAAVPVSAPPPAPAIPQPVQTSWFSPK